MTVTRITRDMLKQFQKQEDERRQEEDRERKRQKFLQSISKAGLPMPTAEYIFHPVRKWRFDYAWPELMLAFEIEGAVWTQGGHTRGSGFMKDMEKYNAAATLGWRLLRTTWQDIGKRETVAMIREAMTV